MRKFVLGSSIAGLLLAIGVFVTSTSPSHATVCEGYCVKKITPQPQTHNVGPWYVGCGIASAGSLMIGTAMHASDKNDPRQLTINEAGWHSAACPFLLPWALLTQATCPDNKATYQVARLAFRFVKKHTAGDQSAFTNAYGEACRTGKLSRDTLRSLNSLI